MTLQQMCSDIANALNERGVVLTFKSGRTIPMNGQLATASDIFNYDVHHGELFMIPIWYFTLFPERLPETVPNPNIDDLRYVRAKNLVQAFDGKHWR